MSSTSPAISVRGLRKSYGEVEAVKGIDFEILPGEVFGLLGPNGAGKTTTVEILEGLRARTGGQVSVLGFDPDTQRQRLKDRIGVCLQATNLPEKIRVHEAMDVFASFYTRNVNLDQLLKRLQLEDKRNAFYSTLSGGQKQRLALALALLNDPQLIFLDEPTTGLDPQVRAEIHILLEELKREQRTILLTTHILGEADRCDRLALLHQGRMVAEGTPEQLRSRIGGDVVVLESEDAAGLGRQIETRFGLKPSVMDGVLRVEISNGHRFITEVVEAFPGAIQSVGLHKPTLEDVFIRETGALIE